MTDIYDPIAERLAEIREDRDLASELPMTADPRRVIDRQVPHLLAALDGVLALCCDTDGHLLPPESEIPVGEFQAVISDALLGTGGP